MGVAVTAVVCALAGCKDVRATAEAKPERVLEAMSTTWGLGVGLEKDFWKSFSQRNGLRIEFVPNTRLGVYQQLLKAGASKPDVLEIDIVWTSILAKDLVDLRPYVDEKAFVPHLLDNYTVDGRLVALPVYVDLGVLYYRPDLLQKYGFHRPPESWDELGEMAARIQAGERKKGNKNFWGYIWQGAPTESGTCNAVEWQAAAGAGRFIEAGKINVRSAPFAAALRRAAGWLGTISPPAEYVYREDDSQNVWDAGQAAFMRNWASGYPSFAQMPGGDRHHFGVAPLPGGAGGQAGTIGGAAVSVSKYSLNRELAIKAVLELTNEANDRGHQQLSIGLPTHVSVIESPEMRSRSVLLAASCKLMKTMVSRPSLVLGEKYELASLEYAKAVNLVLRRGATPEAAMADLEKTLVRVTSLPALAH
jgi:trehalose/maltose transport system substrate-binding protein